MNNIQLTYLAKIAKTLALAWSKTGIQMQTQMLRGTCASSNADFVYILIESALSRKDVKVKKPNLFWVTNLWFQTFPGF